MKQWGDGFYQHLAIVTKIDVFFTIVIFEKISFTGNCHLHGIAKNT